MNPILLAELLRQVGTVGIPLILKLKSDIDAKRTATTVTEEDLLELKRLSELTSTEILARHGVVLPPT